jgi:hypothetical protein
MWVGRRVGQRLFVDLDRARDVATRVGDLAEQNRRRRESRIEIECAAQRNGSLLAASQQVRGDSGTEQECGLIGFLGQACGEQLARPSHVAAIEQLPPGIVQLARRLG